MIYKTDIRTINEFAQPVRLVKLRIVLRELDLFDKVREYIEKSDNYRLYEFFEYGDTIDFLDDDVLAMKEALQISDEQYKEIYYKSI